MTRLLKLGAGVACAAIALGVGLALTHMRASSPAAPQSTSPDVLVTVAQVERQDVPIVLEGLGTVQALNTATIRSQVQGTIDRVDFVEGQSVKTGQTLAQIDPRLYQAQLDQAVSKQAQDAALLANSKRDLERYEKVGTLAQTQQQIDTQRALVTQQEAQIKSDEAASEFARTQLSYTTFTAPFDGITGIRQIDPGNIVHPTDANGLVVITQVQPIAVIFTLPSADIPRAQQALTSGDARVVAFAADNKTKLDDGRVILIDNQADAATGTVRLKAEFPNPRRQLWPGTFVNVHFVISVRHDGLTTPLAAVQQGPQGPYVYAVNPDGTAHIKPVVIGQSRGGQVLIDQGVRAGETVVVAGHYGLTDGAKVTVAKGDARAQVQDASTASAGMLP
jgi:multidrug efflux system membrane fusion protein